jgi:hypothetical protein
MTTKRFIFPGGSISVDSPRVAGDAALLAELAALCAECAREKASVRRTMGTDLLGAYELQKAQIIAWWISTNDRVTAVGLYRPTQEEGAKADEQL